MTATTTFRRYIALRGVGFTPEQARALVSAGFGVIGHWPVLDVLAETS